MATTTFTAWINETTHTRNTRAHDAVLAHLQAADPRAGVPIVRAALHSMDTIVDDLHGMGEDNAPAILAGVLARPDYIARGGSRDTRARHALGMTSPVQGLRDYHATDAATIDAAAAATGRTLTSTVHAALVALAREYAAAGAR